MDIKHLGGSGKELTVRVGESEDETITVTYSLRPLTRSFLADLQGRAAALDPDDPLAEIAGIDVIIDSLALVLLTWDLHDGGEELPITAEVLGSLPVEVLAILWAAIQADAQGAKPAEDGGSGNRAARRAK